MSFSEAIDEFLTYLAIERGHSENYQLLNRRLLGKLASWLPAQGWHKGCRTLAQSGGTALPITCAA